MNIVVVLPYANADAFSICSGVTPRHGPLTEYRIDCSETGGCLTIKQQFFLSASFEICFFSF